MGNVVTSILILYGNISEFLSSKMRKSIIFGQTDFIIGFGAASFILDNFCTYNVDSCSKSIEVKVFKLNQKVTSLHVKVLGFIVTSLLPESK